MTGLLSPLRRLKQAFRSVWYRLTGFDRPDPLAAGSWFDQPGAEYDQPIGVSYDELAEMTLAEQFAAPGIRLTTEEARRAARRVGKDRVRDVINSGNLTDAEATAALDALNLDRVEAADTDEPHSTNGGIRPDGVATDGGDSRHGLPGGEQP